MAQICYRRHAGRLIHSFPLRDDWNHTKPWYPWRRVWTFGMRMSQREIVVYVDVQVVQ